MAQHVPSSRIVSRVVALLTLAFAGVCAADPVYRLPMPKALGKHEAAYVCTQVESGGPMSVLLALGMPGPHKVWVNGVAVCKVHGAATKLAADTSRVPVELRDGPNFILIKICGPGEPKFYFKILGMNGKPLEGLRFKRPLAAGEEAEGYSWACIFPFTCHESACVLDTRFIPELNAAGPPRDVSSAQRWAPVGSKTAHPAEALVNGGFEFVDERDRPIGWHASWGEAQTDDRGVAGSRALVFAAGGAAVSREVLSHPFKIDSRKRTTVTLRYRLGDGTAVGAALCVWLQWLDQQQTVIGLLPVCRVPAQSAATDWQAVRTDAVRPPFGAAFARVQIKTVKSAREVLVDDVSVEGAPDED